MTVNSRQIPAIIPKLHLAYNIEREEGDSPNPSVAIRIQNNEIEVANLTNDLGAVREKTANINFVINGIKISESGVLRFTILQGDTELADCAINVNLIQTPEA